MWRGRAWPGVAERGRRYPKRPWMLRVRAVPRLRRDSVRPAPATTSSPSCWPCRAGLQVLSWCRRVLQADSRAEEKERWDVTAAIFLTNSFRHRIKNREPGRAGPGRAGASCRRRGPRRGPCSRNTTSAQSTTRSFLAEKAAGFADVCFQCFCKESSKQKSNLCRVRLLNEVSCVQDAVLSYDCSCRSAEPD